MRRDDSLRCKCNKPVTRHRSLNQKSWGFWYYTCYKAHGPGHCNFFAWEQQPTPPVTPEMSPKQRNPAPLPKTPTRPQPSFDSKSPLWRSVYNTVKTTSEEEEDGNQIFVTASQTPSVSPAKGKEVNRLYSSHTSVPRQPNFSGSPTKYASSSTRERGIVRSATEGDLSISYDELLKKVDIMQAQLEERQKQILAKDGHIRSLEEEVESLRRENTLLETASPVLFPSPTKSNSRTPMPSSPTRPRELAIESPIRRDFVLDAPVTSHFKKLVPTNDSSVGSRKMWN